ncbi:MAG: hypothetical protein F4059_03260, partial [Gemmatimonadetes bacterium]|nr:hypothetical protein [Gemmatimonadota bacterium]
MACDRHLRGAEGRRGPARGFPRSVHGRPRGTGQRRSGGIARGSGAGGEARGARAGRGPGRDHRLRPALDVHARLQPRNGDRKA